MHITPIMLLHYLVKIEHLNVFVGTGYLTHSSINNLAAIDMAI